jgi:hypothetical protein
MPGDELHETGSEEWNSGWEARRVEQMILALRATPAQRLAWLEEVIALAYRAGALPKRRDWPAGGSTRSPGPPAAGATAGSSDPNPV